MITIKYYSCRPSVEDNTLSYNSDITITALPFGGMKNSGVGREGAREGILEYLETKSVGLSVQGLR